MPMKTRNHLEHKREEKTPRNTKPCAFPKEEVNMLKKLREVEEYTRNEHEGKQTIMLPP